MGVPIWHLGLAVPDLETGMAKFAALFGVDWRPVRIRHLTLTDAAGVDYEVDCEVTFSIGGPFALELWRAIPDTPLATPESGFLHHIGYWTDDVYAEGHRLEGLGYPVAASVGGMPLLQRGPGGLVLELCDLHSDRASLRDLFLPTSEHAGPAVLDSPL